VADERALAFLEELDRADSEVSATLAELENLEADVEALRVRALELDSFLAGLPAERERLTERRVERARLVETSRSELAAGERELATADESTNREAVRMIVALRDCLRTAERKAAEAEAELAQLESRASAAATEAPELLAHASRLAARLRDRPRLAEATGVLPGPTLAGVAEWAGAARAALFVARGSLAEERDALLRQANELGTVLLGESVFAASAADVARRLRSRA
jgi:DNA repair exonuclease SbcCD ATPase subunit